MTKRAASYDIDPVTFEEKERNEEKDNPIDPEGPHMKNRKILKFKRNETTQRTDQTSKPTLSIPGLFEDKQGNDKTQSKPSSSLFGGSLFSASTMGSGFFHGLFSTPLTKMSREKIEGTSQTQNPKTSIFGTAPGIFSSGSIFGNNSTAGSLFGNMPSLFGTGHNQGQGLFPSKSQKDDEDDEGDSAELQKNQNMEVDPSKSKANFAYNEECILLKKVKLSKYKKDKGDLIDSPLIVSLLQDKDNNNKTNFIVVQLEATHKNIFSGVIIPGKSQIRIVNNKSENVQILAFTLSKEKKLEKHVIRLQIINEKEGDDKDFFEVLKKVISDQEQVK